MKSTITARNPLATVKNPVLELHRQQHDDELDFTLADVAELDPTPTPAPTERDIQQFYQFIHRGGTWRFVQNLTAGSEHNKRRSVYFRTDEPVTLPAAWQDDYSNIFHGINPTVVQREYFQASHNDDIAAMASLFREYDAKDFTEPTQHQVDAKNPFVKAEQRHR